MRFEILLLIRLLLLFAPFCSTTLNAIAENSVNAPMEAAASTSQLWQIGIFTQGGFPPAYKVFLFPGSTLYAPTALDLYSAGVEIGRQSSKLQGSGPLRGRGEAMLEVMPFWLARYPPQEQTLNYGGKVLLGPTFWQGKNQHGCSATPFLLRWNFSKNESNRWVPWAQLGGGLLWTNHKFPNAYSSVINFTPQVGAGINVFNRPKRSVNLGFKAIHISNASLGDQNPGLNVTFQFSAGYSWWR